MNTQQDMEQLAARALEQASNPAAGRYQRYESLARAQVYATLAAAAATRETAAGDKTRAALRRAYDWFQEIPDARWERVEGWRDTWERDSAYIRGVLNLQEDQQ